MGSRGCVAFRTSSPPRARAAKSEQRTLARVRCGTRGGVCVSHVILHGARRVVKIQLRFTAGYS
eukprot:3982602-Prymnesium_polylepis.1